MEKVRIGIIGIGNMGSGHAQYLKAGEIQHAELTAVCDISPARLEWAEKTLGSDVSRYSDYKELLSSGKIDLVIIAVPHYLHPVIGIEALYAGIHVLSEKPIGVYTKNIEQLNEVAKESGLVFGIMYNQRTNPYYQKMREMVQGGELGELVRCVWIITDWYRTQAYYNSGGWRATWSGEGGGVLINQCPHNLDLWQWIFGMPNKIRAFISYGKYHDIEVEDDVTAYAEYDNGATGVFITTTGETPGTNRLEITGDKGKLVYEGGKLRFWKNAVPERVFNAETKEGFSRPACEMIEITPEGKGLEHRGITQNVVNAILFGEKLLAPGYEGINGLTISNAMHLSSWTGETVTLPIDKELYLSKLNEHIASSKNKKDTNLSGSVADLSKTYGS